MSLREARPLDEANGCHHVLMTVKSVQTMQGSHGIPKTCSPYLRYDEARPIDEASASVSANGHGGLLCKQLPL